MKQYVTKKKIVNAIQYEEGLGLETRWVVYYWGNYEYEHICYTKEEAIKFKEERGGDKLVDEDDIGNEITYEDPLPIVYGKNIGKVMKPGDYIVYNENNEIVNIMHKTDFENIYELYNRFATLENIREVIRRSGITECEDRKCDGCDFYKFSPENKEFGGHNICMMLGQIFATK
jgi:hypothetical protein